MLGQDCWIWINMYSREVIDQIIKHYGKKVCFNYILSRKEIEGLHTVAQHSLQRYKIYIKNVSDKTQDLILSRLAYTGHDISKIDFSNLRIDRDFGYVRIPKEEVTAEWEAISTRLTKIGLDLKANRVIPQKDIVFVYDLIANQPENVPINVNNLNIVSGLDYSEIVYYNEYANIIGINFSGLEVTEIKQETLNVGQLSFGSFQ